MSAYIVSTTTMQRAVAALATDAERGSRVSIKATKPFGEIAAMLAKSVLDGDVEAARALADEIHEATSSPAETIDGLSFLGRELYKLNQLAIIARYGNNPGDSFQVIPSDFVYDAAIADGKEEAGKEGWRYGLDADPKMEALSSLLYQCSEGDVPSHPLFIRMTVRKAEMEREWKRGERAREEKFASEKAARNAAERLKHEAENPHLVKVKDRPTWPSPRVAAENIRRTLKLEFPGVKFSVKTSYGSMTNRIDVKWTDGPTTKQVEEFTIRHSGGSFDGMTDCYEYADNTFGDVFGEAKYLFVTREATMDGVCKAWMTHDCPEYQKKFKEFHTAEQIIGWWNEDRWTGSGQGRAVRKAWSETSL